METLSLEKTKKGLREIKPKDLLYPGILSIFTALVLILFSLATGFISNNLNIAFSGDSSNDSKSLDLNNYNLVIKKLGINIYVKEETSATQVATPASPQPLATTTPQILDKKAFTLNILNGTTNVGVASSLATLLESNGFAKAKTGNDKTISATTSVAIKEGKSSVGPSLLEIVRKTYPNAISTISPDTALFDVIITIGAK